MAVARITVASCVECSSNLPMMPKMPRMLGAKMTSKLMQVSRQTAIAMWRGQLNVLLGNNICWRALLT